MQALYFFKTKQIIYLAIDQLKHIQVFSDSSLKLHDFTSSLKFVSAQGEKEGLTSQYHKIERLINHCFKGANVIPNTQLNKMIAEDFKNGLDIELIVIKWSKYLRERLDEQDEKGQSILLNLISHFLKNDNSKAIWRFLEVSRFRN